MLLPSCMLVAYVMPAFGKDEKLRREASPLLLLNPEKETSTLGKVALSLSRRYSSSDAIDFARAVSESIELNTSSIPSVLIMNATFDMGLDENGKLMAEELSKYTDVEYVLVKGADHARCVRRQCNVYFHIRTLTIVVLLVLQYLLE